MVCKKQLINPAFTIVELLVVIVVIGILAAITIVSYTGLSSKATLASLQSDLINSSKQLKIFQTVNGNYPTTISLDCSAAPDSITNKCLKLSSGNTITSLTNDYFVNNNTNPQTFSLTIKNSSTNIISLVTESSKPSILVPAPLNPVADWIAVPRDTNNTNYDHYGNYYDTVSKTYATVSRATTKTIYDPNTQHIYDVPANKLAINPRSDGKSGYEGVVEEGRTNLVINSYFNTGDFTNWSIDNKAVAEVSIDNSQTIYGTKAVKIDKSILGQSPCIFSARFAVTANTTYTASAFYKNSDFSSGASIFYLRWYDSGGASISSSTTVSPPSSTTWSRSSVIVAAPSNAATADIILRANNSFLGQLWYGAAQVETGAFVTSYIPTTNSTVTRNADVVTVPTTNWVATPASIFGVVGSPGDASLSDIFSRSNEGAGLQSAISSGEFYPKILGGDLNYQSPDSHIAISLPGVVAATWDNTTVNSYANGTASTVGTITPRISSNVALRIGARVDNFLYYNGPISRIITYSTALSSVDVSSVTNSIKNGP